MKTLFRFLKGLGIGFSVIGVVTIILFEMIYAIDKVAIFLANYINMDVPLIGIGLILFIFVIFFAIIYTIVEKDN